MAYLGCTQHKHQSIRQRENVPGCNDMTTKNVYFLFFIFLIIFLGSVFFQGWMQGHTV
jgi:hypothetical protein